MKFLKGISKATLGRDYIDEDGVKVHIPKGESCNQRREAYDWHDEKEDDGDGDVKIYKKKNTPRFPIRSSVSSEPISVQELSKFFKKVV